MKTVRKTRLALGVLRAGIAGAGFMGVGLLLVLTLSSCPNSMQMELLKDVSARVEEQGKTPTYTVTYDANGATSGTVPVDNATYAAGQQVTVLDKGTLALTDFNFTGWNTNSEGFGVNYASGQTFVMGTGDVALYAKWTSNPTYELSYDANGATGGSAPPSSSHEASSVFSVSDNTGGLLRTGYTLEGWNSQQNGSGTTYALGTGQFTMPAGNVTLFATWKINQYTVCFNSQGGTVVPSQTVDYGSTVDAPDPAPTRYNYSFGGWYIDFACTTPWSFSTPITVSRTIYGKWDPLPGALWTERSLPSSQKWWSVAYGANTFVAIATDSNVCASSTDGGVHWTQHTLPSSQEWYSVAYGGGTFVAVARNSNMAATSTDGGVHWTPRVLPSIRSWHSVAYGESGVFVAVADGSVVGRSSNYGVSWSEYDLPSFELWESIAYGVGTFVTLSNDSNVAASSSNGIGWSSHTLAGNQRWQSVVFGGNKFVAIEYASNIGATSPDGLTWTPCYLQTNTYWASIAYGLDTFVAVDMGAGSGSTFATRSEDGVNWTNHGLPATAKWHSVAYGGGVFVAVASGPSKLAATSP